MIAALLRRSLVDLWDNAVICFALNLAFLGVLAVLLFAVAQAASLAPVFFAAALVSGLWALIVMISFAAGLIDQVARRADLEPARALPDLSFCLLAGFGIAGLAGFAILLIGRDAANPAIAIAQTIAGIWLAILAIQGFVLSVAMALESEMPAHERLAVVAALALRYPIRVLVLAGLSTVALAATVGLLPGPAGAAYLFLRTGRVMRKALAGENIDAVLLSELGPLKNRTPRNLLQPWRAS